MPKVHLGTAGWTIPRRVANEFPTEGSALVRYAARFSAAEINSTFHRSHQPQTRARWAAAVPEEFRFAVKMPKVITHGLRLVGTTEVLATFLEEARNLGGKTGPFLLQLPPSLAYDYIVASPFFALLRTYTSHDVVCEPRHPSWFEAEADNVLTSFGIARVAADPALSRSRSSGRDSNTRVLSLTRRPANVLFPLRSQPQADIVSLPYESSILSTRSQRFRDFIRTFHEALSDRAQGSMLDLQECNGPRLQGQLDGQHLQPQGFPSEVQDRV